MSSSKQDGALTTGTSTSAATSTGASSGVTSFPVNSSITASLLASITGCEMTHAFFFFGLEPCSTLCVTDSPSIRHLSCLCVHLKHTHHSPGGHVHITCALMHMSQERPMSLSGSCLRCQLSDPHNKHDYVPYVLTTPPPHSWA